MTLRGPHYDFPSHGSFRAMARRPFFSVEGRIRPRLSIPRSFSSMSLSLLVGGMESMERNGMHSADSGSPITQGGGGLQEGKRS